MIPELLEVQGYTEVKSWQDQGLEKSKHKLQSELTFIE